MIGFGHIWIGLSGLLCVLMDHCSLRMPYNFYCYQENKREKKKKNARKREKEKIERKKMTR
jgi:hypothetical protein